MVQQTSNVQFLVRDSHARADIYAWNPRVQLPALLKSNKQAVTYAEHMVDNPRGMLPTHLDAFERRDRLPLCSFAWGTAMNGQKPVHGTPMYDYLHYWNPTNSCKLKLNMWQTTCRVRQLCKYIDVKGGIHSQCVVSCGGQPCMGGHLCLEHPCVAAPLSKHEEQVETHTKHMVNNPGGMLPTHLHAFERRDKLPMCGFSWGTAMHGQTCIHGTPMYNCPPYWNPIHRR